MAKISVIVPVYKVEPYLRCCIDSILAQTFRDFELILVDDGSPDNCGAICEEYAAKDDRIIVIHQENGGQSAARNTGIDWCFANSDSEWITFIDSDDYVTNTYLEKLQEFEKDKNIEVVCSKVKVFWGEGKPETSCNQTEGFRILSGRDVCISLYTCEDVHAIHATGKLFKKALFKCLRFPVGKIHEDQDLTPKLLYNAQMVVILDMRLYYYRQVSGSIVHSPFSLKRFDDIEAIESCVNYFINYGDLELSKLAQKKKMTMWAEYCNIAWRFKIYDSLPEHYKLPKWKMILLLLRNTIRKGGTKLIILRIGNLIKRIKR